MKRDPSRVGRHISVTPELDSFVKERSAKGFRGYSQQVEMMLQLAKGLIADKSEDEIASLLDKQGKKKPQRLEV